MERAIGEVFEFEGKKLIVVECIGCCFEFDEHCVEKRKIRGFLFL